MMSRGGKYTRNTGQCSEQPDSPTQHYLAPSCPSFSLLLSAVRCPDCLSVINWLTQTSIIRSQPHIGEEIWVLKLVRIALLTYNLNISSKLTVPQKRVHIKMIKLNRNSLSYPSPFTPRVQIWQISRPITSSNDEFHQQHLQSAIQWSVWQRNTASRSYLEIEK